MGPYSNTHKRKKFNISKSTIYLHDTPAGENVLNYQDNIKYAESWYMSKVKQGSTLVPQPMWFVEHDSGDLGNSHTMPKIRTNRKLSSKERWKTLQVSGAVESEFLFTTIRSSSMIPFGIKSSDMVVLPIISHGDKYRWYDSQKLISVGKTGMGKWMESCENVWENSRKQKSHHKLLKNRLDYNNAVTDQNPRKKIVLLYNRSGREYMVSCIVSDKIISKNNGFIADNSSYYYYPENMDEAKYLCAVLNSSFLFRMVREIKAARDIHRTVWNIPIPRYDSQRNDHKLLIKYYNICYKKVLKQLPQTRKQAIALLEEELHQIDKIVKRVLETTSNQ